MEPREKTGKNENRRIRKAGFVPCIIYGPEIKENIKGKVNMREIEKILAGRWESTRLNVKLPDGAEEPRGRTGRHRRAYRGAEGTTDHHQNQD